MFKICVTRFNNKTFKENERWKDKNGFTFHKRIYNTSVKIKPGIPIKTEILVIEMNNDTNKIIAFSIIRNIPEIWKYKIYSNGGCNRYSYTTNEYIYVDQIIPKYDKEVNILINELFYGKGHLKRGNGIQEVPQKKIDSIKEFIQEIYLYIKNTNY